MPLDPSTIRERRKELGLTVTQLGAMVGVSPGYISHLQAGNRVAAPALEAKLRAALALGGEQPPVEDVDISWTDPDPAAHQVAVERVALWSDHRVALLRCRAEIDTDGTLQVTREFVGVRARPGRTVQQIRYRDRSASAKWTSDVALTERPAGLEVDRLADDAGRVVGFRFPRELTEADGAIGYTLTTCLSAAYDPSGVEPGCLRIAIRQVVDRLEISCRFPPGLGPLLWRPLAWEGRERLADQDDILRSGSCAGYRFHRSGTVAEMSIDAPMIGVSYAMYWSPRRTLEVS